MSVSAVSLGLEQSTVSRERCVTVVLIEDHHIYSVHVLLLTAVCHTIHVGCNSSYLPGQTRVSGNSHQSKEFSCVSGISAMYMIMYILDECNALLVSGSDPTCRGVLMERTYNVQWNFYSRTLHTADTYMYY